MQKVTRVFFYFCTEYFDAFSNITVMTVGVTRAMSSIGKVQSGSGGVDISEPKIEEGLIQEIRHWAYR